MTDRCLQKFCDEEGSWHCDKSLGHDDLHICRKKMQNSPRDYEFREWNRFGKTQPAEYMGRVELDYPTPTEDIQEYIKYSLIPDATRVLFHDNIDMSTNPVIEIRAKLTHIKGEIIPGIHRRWGIAWFYALPYTEDLEGFEYRTLDQEPLFDFDGQMHDAPFGGYLLLARIML